MRKAMDALFTGLKKGDRVLLHFSGHGSFLPSQETGEDDKLDELICLHDMDFNDDGTFLRDKEMRDWTRKKPDGVTLVVVLDNCHSGSGTRLAIAPPTGRRGVASMTADVDMRSSQARNSGEFHAGNFTADDEFIVRNRFLTPPAFAHEMAATARRATMRAAVQTKDLNHLLLAACRENQTAADAMICSRSRTDSSSFHSDDRRHRAEGWTGDSSSTSTASANTSRASRIRGGAHSVLWRRPSSRAFSIASAARWSGATS